MLKKKVITFEGNPEYYVTKHDTHGLKKGRIVEVPKGYEIVLIEADGTTEIVKNQYSYKLPNPYQYVFYVKSNRKIIKTNWGTASRVQTRNTNNESINIGGYGTIEFQMMNPVRLINYRLNNDAYIDEQILIDGLLSKLPEALHEAVGVLSPVDDQDIVNLEKNIKKETLKVLSYTANLMGLEIVDFVVEHLNIQNES